MATIITRAGKGALLTNAELDANFTNLNSELATKTTTEQAAAAAPVQSVAGKTGAVTLGPSDVGAAAASHTHTKSQITDLSLAWSEITGKPASFTPSAHGHAIADVAGLQVALDGKAASSHTHGVGDLPTAVRNLAQGLSTQDPNLAVHPVILSNHANSPSTGSYWHITTTFYSAISDSANRGQIAVQYNGGNQVYARSCFQGEWTPWVRCDNNGAAPVTHTHTKAEITDLSLAWGDITGKPSSFTPSAHGHPISDVTGLQAALDGKSATSHTHSYLPLSGGTLSGMLYSASLDGAMASGNSAASFEVRNSSGSTGDYGMAMINFHCQGAYAMKIGCRSDGYFGIGGWSSAAWRWYSASDGTMVASGNVVAYSDPRLKEDFKRIERPMDILDKLDGGTFVWKHGIKHTEVKAGKRDYGVLADQVEAVMPEIVSGSIEIDGETYRTVAYEKLVPVLIEAVKELKAEVDALRTMVGAHG